MKTTIRFASFAAAILAGAIVHAAGPQADGHGSHDHAQQPTPAPASATELVDGEVRKVDVENRKLTLRHGPLANLDMPGMTMVFQVKDESVLQGLQPGDKVRFVAEKVDGRFTVVRLEPAP